MLAEKINADFLQALKDKKATVVSSLRLLKSEITKKEKEGKELTEEIVVQVVRTQVKKLKEAIEEYQKAGRQDLVDKEAAELKIIEQYSPQQLTEDQLVVIIDRILAQAGENKNFGQLMGLVMKEAGGQADGQVVSRLVKEKLVD
ncbi:MAG: GatB/YqeY domain-containing protein [Patescibacteria group bacterium]